MDDHELPAGWAAATVDDLGEYINGCAFKPADWHDNGTPIVRIQNLTDPDKPLNVTQREVDQKYHIEKRDILVSWSATLDVFRWGGPLAYVNQHIFKVLPSEHLDDRFVEFALKKAISELINSEHLHGSTMKHINRKPFLAHPINVPPFPEQQRIVEKIETLFAELDKGEEALREVQKLLARYRQSVLKAAVTGTLTADWRAANGPLKESGEDLLARILKTRRETWQGRGKYKEPVEPDTDGLPVLPEGWTWTTLEMLGEISTGNTPPTAKKSEYYGGSVPFLKPTDLDQGNAISSCREWLTDIGSEKSRLVSAGAVMVTSIGATTGKTGVCRFATAAFNQQINAVSPLPQIVSGDLLYFMIIESGFQNRLWSAAAATTLPIINKSKFSRLLVPCPPLNEQDELLERIELAMERTEQTEIWCETELKRSAALRQSVLKDAFSGKLVPQDRSDEPADKLLDRIRASREEKPKAKPKKPKA